MLQLSHSQSAYSRDGPSPQQLAAAVALTGCRAQDTSVTQHEVAELGSLMSKRRIKVSTGLEEMGGAVNHAHQGSVSRTINQAGRQEQPPPPPAGRASAQQVDTKAGSRDRSGEQDATTAGWKFMVAM